MDFSILTTAAICCGEAHMLEEILIFRLVA